MSAAPHKWRDLMDQVIEAREALGLNPTDLSVLRTILSFIPGDHLSITRPEGHVCFARNTTIAERLGRSGDSTVNRSVRRLEKAGLIARHYSTNRKRYARRSGAGEITHAYGIDVAPMIKNRRMIDELAAAARTATERLEALREDCKACLGRLLAQIQSATDMLTDHIQTVLDTARLILRRKPTEEGLVNLRQQLEDLFSQSADLAVSPCTAHPTREPSEVTLPTKKMSSTNRQSEQHKDSDSNPSKKKACYQQVSFEDLERSFPRLMSFLRTSRDMDDFQRRTDALASGFPGMEDTWRLAKHEFGFQVSLLCLGYITQHHDRITNPGGYLRALIKSLQSERLSLGDLIWDKDRRSSREEQDLGSGSSPSGPATCPLWGATSRHVHRN